MASFTQSRIGGRCRMQELRPRGRRNEASQWSRSRSARSRQLREGELRAVGQRTNTSGSLPIGESGMPCVASCHSDQTAASLSQVSMTTFCANNEKPAENVEVKLFFEDGSEEPGLWTGDEWRCHGNEVHPVSWRPLSSADASLGGQISRTAAQRLV